MAHETLLSPARIGSMELRNRIIMTPMGSNLAQADGHCGDRIQAYYEARARGGAGMIIVGVGAIAWPDGACNPNQVALSSDDFLPGLTALASRVKQHGCRAGIQLQHAGKVAVCDIAAGRAMLVPSLPSSSPDEMTQALTAEELGAFVKSYTADGARIEYKVADSSDIAWLIERFASAAERAQRAGFDGVEVHAGHGYIISEFLSPHANQREDEYGGSLQNRARLLVQVIRAIKSRCGEDYPVWCRIDSTEYRIEGGICFEDALETAAIAEASGADAINVSAYANPASGAGFTEAPLVHEPGGYLGFAAGIKSRVAIPVIAVGRIEPEVAEQVLARGEADFIAMGRKLLADPELPNKLLAGHPEQVRPCIYCYTCVSRIFVNDHVRCAVNAQTAFEEQRVIAPASEPRHLLIAGGGPAGMEAARVAATRGHRVTLVERSGQLGGTVFFSSIVYPPNGRLIDYLAGEIRRLGVDIRLSTELDEALLRSIQPDEVVVASGALRDAPDLPGARGRNVFSGDELRGLMTGQGGTAAAKLPAWQRLMLWAAGVLGVTRNAALLARLSKLWMPLGRRVCILGGGLVGVELAEFLAERGREVSVVEEGEKFGVELAVVRRWRVLEELQKLGVVMIPEARPLRIDSAGVTLEISGESIDIPADTVVLASGATANPSLADMCRHAGYEPHVVGDCGGVGYIEGAILEGNAIGRQL